MTSTYNGLAMSVVPGATATKMAWAGTSYTLSRQLGNGGSFTLSSMTTNQMYQTFGRSLYTDPANQAKGLVDAAFGGNITSSPRGTYIHEAPNHL